MNIVNRLTWRQLMLNKKRTLVTVIGAVISVAMITAVASLGLSFMDMLRRQEIAQDGEWHVLYNGVNKTQFEAIQKDGETKTLILSRDAGYASLENSDNPNKPYLFIKEYNAAGFEKFPVELIKGRLPETPDEIVISQAILDNGKVGLKTGDTLTLNLGRRRLDGEDAEGIFLDQNTPLQRGEEGVQESLTKESVRTFTVVGVIERPSWEPTWSPGYTVLTFLDEETLAPGNTANASVIVKNLNGKLFEHAQALAESHGIAGVGFNNSLLSYYGLIKDDAGRNVIYTLTAIVMVIIIIGSVSLIYNAFAISVSERSKHLGMLSSVGATKKQKRNSVFFEGVIIGTMSIPVGVLAGLAGIGLTFVFINPLIKNTMSITEDLTLVVSPLSLMAAIAISILTIMISTWVPARRASNISAIDAIRQSTDFKLTGKVIRTWKLTRNLFGIEGDLGLKNLKRDRTKYKATVFSLVISIILFLVISSFTHDLKKALGMSQDGINFDVMMSIDNGEDSQVLINNIGSLDNITEFSRIASFNTTSWFNEEELADSLKASYGEPRENGQYSHGLRINVLDDEALRRYAQEVGVDIKALKDPNKLNAILVDVITYKDRAQDKYIEARVINTRVGEKLDQSFYDWELDKDVDMKPLEIAALTHKLPMGMMHEGLGASFNVIISRDVYNELAQNHTKIRGTTYTDLYMRSDDPMGLQEEIEAYLDSIGENRFYVYNVYQARQREGQMVLLMSVFTYGFMVLITAICIANILNTISTSIALRKREFAMLKSVGMTPKGFNRMINYESIFYGIKALLLGLPLSFAVMYLIFNVLRGKFSYAFTIPWLSVAVVIVAVFVIVGVAMLYSSAKVKRENIIDVLKQEII